MKAVVYHRYGGPGVVALAEVAKPSCKDHEVLIRIHATTVTTGDWRARSLTLPAGFGFLGRLVFGVFGPRKPILGTELAGEIEAVGKAVTRFAVGDQVFAFTGASYGCHAEYRTVREDGLIARKPGNLSYEEAAALSFGGATALRFLRDKGGIQRGDKVLIVGASGGVGTAAVQIAKHLGATVTGVCGAKNVDLVRSIGADRVIDYTKADFATAGERYDIVLDTTGTTSFARVEDALEQGGRLLLVQASFAQSLGLGRPPRASGKKVIAGVATVRAEDLRLLGEIAARGEIRPVIDRSYPLKNAAAAHAYVDTGRKRGNVVLTVDMEPRATMKRPLSQGERPLFSRRFSSAEISHGKDSALDADESLEPGEATEPPAPAAASAPKRAIGFKEFLRSMPDASEDADFERPRDYGRPEIEWDT